MDPVVVGIFLLVYVGMILGEVPALRLDRSRIALIGAVALVASGRMTTSAAWSAVDLSTIGLLVGLMVISAHFSLAGSYAEMTRRLGRGALGPGTLLALLILVTGGLSAVLAPEIVCLAIAPVLIEVCVHRRLDPVPFLLALACASNVGSAATLIGTPQNILVGQTLQMSFALYLVDGAGPAIVGLAVVWLAVWLTYRRRWSRESPPVDVHPSAFDRWHTAQGIVVLVVVMVAFLFAPWPREVVALSGAAVLIASRPTASRALFRLIDWRLAVLVVALFVVNKAIAQSGFVSGLLMMTRMRGLDLTDPPALFVTSAVLSNIVTPVPAVMLLLPAARDDFAGAVLALSSTLAGNFAMAGSIANIIVVEQAARLGHVIKGRTHRRIGIPVTLATLALAAAWLALRSLG